MIHLLFSKTNASFCGKSSKNDILTSERPPNREVAKLCAECKKLYNQNLENERLRQLEALNNRPVREKFHDWLSGLASLGESDMELIMWPTLILFTAGLIVPAKHLAKLMLKVGI